MKEKENIGPLAKVLGFPVMLVTGFQRKFPLAAFIIKRFVTMIVMLFFLGLAVFGLMQLAPGDMVETYVRSQMMMDSKYHRPDNAYTEETIREYKHQLGLDQPFYIQYGNWLYKVFAKGDLGQSLITKAPILFLIRDRMINSVILNMIELILLTVFSFALSLYFSSKAHTKIDVAATLVALFLHAFPSMLLLILLQLFAAITKLFPITAYPDFPITDSVIGFFASYSYGIALPLLGIFLSGIGGNMRTVRAMMLDQLGQPYVTALRARGIPEPRVYFNHAFRNTLNPFITGSSNIFAGLFSGSLILEIIFSYPGVGRLMYEAVRQEDIYLVLANMIFTSFLILLGMMISDIVLAFVDPRIRYERA